MPESSLRQSRDHPYHKDRFAYDESNDSFMCPQGKVLPFERIHIPPNGVRYRFYRAPGAVCRACPAFGVCTKSKDGRNVTVGPYGRGIAASPRLGVRGSLGGHGRDGPQERRAEASGSPMSTPAPPMGSNPLGSRHLV